MTAITDLSGPAASSYLTILPARITEATTVTHQVGVLSPWGSPLLMGLQGTTADGEAVLILLNETPLNMLRPTQPLDDPDKWQLEMLHIQRFAADAKIATGREIFLAVEKGPNPPDAVVHANVNGDTSGWELTTLTIESRRLAHDLFARVRAKLAFQQRHRIGHLTGYLVYMWFGMASHQTGLPYRRQDEAAAEELITALTAYQPDPEHYTVKLEDGGPPAQLPAQFDSVTAPGDVAFFCTPLVNAVPTSPLFTLTGMEVGLAYQSNHPARAEWDRLHRLIEKKDRPGNDVLLISVGAPDRLGNQHVAEEVLASFLLDNPEAVGAKHLSAVFLHFWSTGRAVNLLGPSPQEAWPAIYQGLTPASQPFVPARQSS